MEKYLQEENRAFLVGYRGCYVCDLLCVFDTFFDFSKPYNDFSFQHLHLFFKTKIINTVEKELPNFWTTYWAVKHVTPFKSFRKLQ